MESNEVNSGIIKNSLWGISSNVLQTIFVSSFFIIIARSYSSGEFSRFLIATTVYQLMAAFSSMGLTPWFIRHYESTEDKILFASKFINIQIGFGFAFYVASIPVAFLMYDDAQIRSLSVILGLNIIFDNIINALKALNIAELKQKKTAVIQIIDGFLKLLVGGLVIITSLPIATLAIILVMVRLATLTLFLNMGSANTISIAVLKRAYITFNELKEMLLKNWQFVIISSISIVYWKVANIIISKYLTLHDVAEYEVASAIFSVVSFIPVIVSITVYPQFIKYFRSGNFLELKKLYKRVFIGYTVFAILSYAFIYSFAVYIIPIAFGKGYPGAISCLQEMFLTFLMLPTVLLQANMIVAIGLEKLDMWFNVVSLVAYVILCIVGLSFYTSLAVINYSIFFSFVIFHLCQDVLLIRRKLTTLSHCLIFYVVVVSFLWTYHVLSALTNPFFLFLTFFMSVTVIVLFFMKKYKISYLIWQSN